MEETANFATLYGFTEQEIRNTYGQYIEENHGGDVDKVMGDLKNMYNGYRFHPMQEDNNLVYNPWSVLKYLNIGALEPHWAASGGPSHLTIEMLGMHGMDILRGFTITKADLFAPISATKYKESWMQAAFQSGYATIKSVTNVLEMSAPNEEVREWLSAEMCKFLVPEIDGNLLHRYAGCLKALDFRGAQRNLQNLICKLSNGLLPRNENQFSAYALHNLRTCQFDGVYTEIAEALGKEKEEGVRAKRFDGALLFKVRGIDWLLVVELKYGDNDASAALQQIKTNQYVRRALEYLYRAHDIEVSLEHVYCVGINLLVGRSVKVHLVAEPAQA